MADFEKKFKIYVNLVNDYLLAQLDGFDATNKVAAEAMRHSVCAGGKRLRPVFLLAAYEACAGKKLESALPFAAAIEFIHTFSLIHDDMPFMDDSDLRRGVPTCHKIFGEAVATLAGLALLTHAFKVTCGAREIAPETAREINEKIAEAIGLSGMIGGQLLDITAEFAPDIGNLPEIEKMYAMKTGALLTCSLEIGGILAGANDEKVAQLKKFGDAFGLAFQIKDDYLDALGDEKIIGKSAGLDEKNKKTTYVSVCGLSESLEKIAELTKKSKQILNENFEDNGKFLIWLTENLLKI